MAGDSARGPIGVRRVIALALVCAVAACSSGAGGEADRSTTVGTSAPTDLSDPSDRSDPSDLDVVEAYVTAMADGDLAGAQEYRCRDAVVPVDGRAALADQMRRMIAENGPLSFSRGEVDPDPVRFDVLEDLVDPVVLRVWLSFDGDERPQPLLLFVATDGGERRICGHAQARSPEITRALDGKLRDLGPTSTSLDDLVAVPTPDGYSEGVDEEVTYTEVSSPVAVEAVRRLFMHASGYGGVTVDAARFASADDALAFAEDRVWERLGDSVGFEFLDAPVGAFALVVASYNTTNVQPADTWPVVTRTVLVYGDVVVAVQQAPARPDGSDHVWASVVAAVDAVARPAG